MKYLKLVWGKIRLTVIILLSIVIGAVWMYNYQSFRVMKCEAEATWTHVQSIQEQRKEIDGIHTQENSVGESVGVGSVEPTSTETYEQSEGGEADTLVSSPPSGIEKIIRDVAKEKQFNDPDLLVRIAKAESSLDPCATNPHSSATGLYQILDMHGLTKAERCNPRIATAWTIDKINSGGISAWNSSKLKWNI